MRLITVILAVAVFGGLTGGAYLASAGGAGLPGMLAKPVSVRQESASPATYRGHRHPMFIYFGSRRHFGGGFHGGK